MPKYVYHPIDIPELASRLPEPLQKPAGQLGGFLEQLLGINDPTGSVMGAAAPTAMPAVTLLSKGQMLENLLNHVKDAEGTPLQKAVEAAAEKAPHVLGHISEIKQDYLPMTGQLGFSYGVFRGNPAHMRAAGAVKGLPIGKIAIDPTAHDLTIPALDVGETVGHELTHAAQAMMKGPAKWDAAYQTANELHGYHANPYELGANKAGYNLQQRIREMLMEEMKKRSSK
jgi:hypothetical protein